MKVSTKLHFSRPVWTGMSVAACTGNLNYCPACGYPMYMRGLTSMRANWSTSVNALVPKPSICTRLQAPILMEPFHPGMQRSSLWRMLSSSPMRLNSSQLGAYARTFHTGPMHWLLAGLAMIRPCAGLLNATTSAAAIYLLFDQAFQTPGMVNGTTMSMYRWPILTI